MLQDVPAGPGDADAVQEAEEICVENIDQAFALALRLGLASPVGESSLRRFGRLADGVDVKALRAAEESVGRCSAGDVASRDEGDLIPEVA